MREVHFIARVDSRGNGWAICGVMLPKFVLKKTGPRCCVACEMRLQLRMRDLGLERRPGRYSKAITALDIIKEET